MKETEYFTMPRGGVNAGSTTDRPPSGETLAPCERELSTLPRKRSRFLVTMIA